MIDNLELCRWAYNEMKHGQTERVRMKQEGKQISFLQRNQEALAIVER